MIFIRYRFVEGSIPAEYRKPKAKQAACAQNSHRSKVGTGNLSPAPYILYHPTPALPSK